MMGKEGGHAMASRKKPCVMQGYPWFPGGNPFKDGYNFAVEVPEGARASLLLYHKKAKTPSMEIPFQEEDKVGDVCAVFLKDFSPEEYEYNYQINGVVVQDPYAYRIYGRDHFGQEIEEEHRIRCGLPSSKEYDWEEDTHPLLSYEEMILYKVHVRGYTKQCKNMVKKKGTFAGLIEMIPYWKELGVNAIELMPAYEFEERALPKKNNGMITEKRTVDKVNFWGYVPGFYFAPKASYCAGKEPENEVRDLIKALHRAGMECIMEMYFPETVNPSVALKAVQFWKLYYHVDGFHLMGDGAPVDLIVRDPLLHGTKLFAGGFSPDLIRKRGERNHRNLAEYHPGFLQDMRRFLKSDEDTVPGAAYRIKRNPQDFAVVNYMASQDGFTLADTVTYTYKHNEANGEDNQDGSSYNFSWNCGVEGPSRKMAIRQIRDRQLRNAFLMVLLSQGVPMIYGGDEFGNSQEGNNNAYCQDNPTGWIDWKSLKKNSWLKNFVEAAIAFRREHPILHMPEELRGVDYQAKGYPDISFHGERAWYCTQDNTCRLLGVMYCGAYAQKENGEADDLIYVGYNFHWEARTIALPNLTEGMKWKKVVDTSDGEESHFFVEQEETYEKSIEIGPRTIVVLTGKQEA